MWQQIKLGYIEERFCGFTIPRESKLVLFGMDDVHELDLRDPAGVVHHEFSLQDGDIDEENHTLRFGGEELPMLGLWGGGGITSAPDGEHLRLDTWEKRRNRQLEIFRRLQIVNAAGDIVFEFEDQDMSGDWACATYSTDYKYVVFGMPYDVYAFERVEQHLG